MGEKLDFNTIEPILTKKIYELLILVDFRLSKLQTV
jgi:hypothetical protein